VIDSGFLQAAICNIRPEKERCGRESIQFFRV